MVTGCTKGSDVIAFRSSRCCGSWSACHSCIFNLNGARDLVGFSLDYSGGRHQLKAQDTLTISLPQSRASLSRVALLGLLLMMLAALGLHTLFQMNELSWQLALPSSYQWSLRWPRMLTALCAGIGLALAGSILQRLIYNPLASPDILGVSSGATFALVFANLFLGQSLLAAHWVTALLGSLLVLAALVVLGKHHQYAASSLILTGIAITALLESLVQFCLAKGSEDSYRILQWLAGSTYRVTPDQALLLAAATIALSRWLTLISIGRSFASARGVNVNAQSTSLILLTIVALLCALVTATMGPVSFVGLIAPHMAMMLGKMRISP